MKSTTAINEKYEASIIKIISTISKTEKQLRKSIIELENIEIENLTEESDTIKLLSTKTENTLEILNHFNSMLIHTIFTINNINKVEVK
jgi:hypothetical protein